MKNKPSTAKDLMQILLNIIVIGIFSVIENWLLFYYEGTWQMAAIFGILSTLMCCVLAINIYNSILELKDRGSSQTDDKQMAAVLYKQMKKLEEELAAVKNTQLRSAKAIVMKEEELQAMVKKLQEQSVRLTKESENSSVEFQANGMGSEAFAVEPETLMAEQEVASAVNEIKDEAEEYIEEPMDIEDVLMDSPEDLSMEEISELLAGLN